MPAISFNKEFLDALLSGDKPLRLLTATGLQMFREGYPFVKTDRCTAGHHAHFLGKVKITEVYDVLPLQCTCGEEAWAKKDGFAGYGDASARFESRYGEGWVDRWWTVIRWDGWAERYFVPKP